MFVMRTVLTTVCEWLIFGPIFWLSWQRIARRRAVPVRLTLGMGAAAALVIALLNWLWFYGSLPGFYGFLNGALYYPLPALAWGMLLAGLGGSLARLAWDSNRDSNTIGTWRVVRHSGIVLLAPLVVFYVGLGGVVRFVAASGVISDNAPAQYRAALANIRKADASEAIPPTDVSHMVLVTQSMAKAAATQAIGGSGANLGAEYEVAGLTLQSVASHLYWISYLAFTNAWGNRAYQTSPGFVAVDAEDPGATAQLHVNLHLVYLPENPFPYTVGVLPTGQHDLLRWVYGHGYDTCKLVDPTIEVDDHWYPYFTISCDLTTQGGTGEVVSKVLIVDPQTGAISAYDAGTQPQWIDRVMPADLVATYASDWGAYHAGLYWTLGSEHKEQPVDTSGNDLAIVYNTADTPVYVIPMTSTNQADSSSTGMILYDTRRRAGVYYPFAGHAVGAAVKDAFKNAHDNIRNYAASTPLLYVLYGTPTWVTIYTSPVQNGESFAGLGFLDATHPSSANVVMVSTTSSGEAGAAKSAGLLKYNGWLARSAGGQIATAHGVPDTVVTGVVWRSRCDATTCQFMLKGDTHIYIGDAAAAPYYLPLVQAGDTVRVTYLDTQQTTRTIKDLVDLTILANAPASASATTTPSVAP